MSSVSGFRERWVQVLVIGMRKRMTVALDEEVYEGLLRRVGRSGASQFIEDLLRPHVLDSALDEGYEAMAADKAREVEARVWLG